MNMVPTQNFTPEYEVTGLEKTENSNPKLAGLMKVWENKQKTAGKIGTFGLMAVGLSACGGSDSEPEEEEIDLGQIFNLTIDADANTAGIDFDNIIGTAFDDVFEAGLALFNAAGTIGQALVPTLQGGDVIDGGEGDNDELNAVVNGNFGFISGNAPTITGVEVINIQVENSPLIPGFGSATVLMDFQNVNGVEELWLVDSDDNAFPSNSEPFLIVANIQNIVTVGVRNVEDATYVLSYDEGVLSEGAEQAVVLIDASNVDVNFVSSEDDADDAITTLSITSAGENEDITFGGDALGGVETVNVVGDGGSLDFGNQFNNLVTLAAGDYDGDLTIDLSMPVDVDVLMDVETGSGDDSVTVDAGIFDRAPADSITIAMGDGVDTLTLTGDVQDFAAQVGGVGPYITDFTTAAISGVEILELSVDLDFGSFIDVTFDMDGLNDVTTIVHTGVLNLGDVLVVNGPASLTAIYEMDADYDMLDLGEGVTTFTATFQEDGGSSSVGTFSGEDVVDLVINVEADHDVTITDVADVDALETLTVNLGEEGSFTGPTSGPAPMLETFIATGGADSSVTATFSVAASQESSLSTIDLSGMEAGSMSTIFVGGTGDLATSPDLTIFVGEGNLTYNGMDSNDVRETFTFTGDNIEDINIVGFEAGGFGNQDQLDFSQFDGVSEASDLNISFDGGIASNSAVITSDAFEGSIVLEGVTAADITDLQASIIY